jgi:GT2 family glycosyltransferase
VVLDPQAPARALALLDEHGCDAVVGAYTPTTPVPGLFTRLKNLQHSYVHRVNAGRVGTFWAGCSAIRREALLGVEGFDEDLRYCEDIALGHKLARAGRTIRLDPSVSATHLKPYTLHSWMKSDLYGRAVPWSRLILSGRAHPGELNTKWRGVVEGLASLLFLASPLLTLLFGKLFLWGLVCAAALLVLLNLRFIGYAYRHATLGTALMLVPYLVLHYLIAFCGLTIGLFRRRLPVNNGV